MAKEAKDVFEIVTQRVIAEFNLFEEQKIIDLRDVLLTFVNKQVYYFLFVYLFVDLFIYLFIYLFIFIYIYEFMFIPCYILCFFCSQFIRPCYLHTNFWKRYWIVVFFITFFIFFLSFLFWSFKNLFISFQNIIFSFFFCRLNFIKIQNPFGRGCSPLCRHCPLALWDRWYVRLRTHPYMPMTSMIMG